MKAITTCLAAVLSISFMGGSTTAHAQKKIDGEKRSVADETRQEYFLIPGRHANKGAEPEAGYKLLLVLPGGTGSAAFHPFIKNIARNALGEDYLVAQLISVKWTKDQKIVWPTKNSKVPGMKFATEDFIAAVIGDVKKAEKIDEANIYTLSWSSGGPAAYAASLSVDAIKGSFVAMSVFKPKSLPKLERAKGHRYYLLHSPKDSICPFRMAENAKAVLSGKNAAVKLETYDGGHGWHGNVFENIRKGMQWLEKR